ncbi:bifunctional riboflavin kinase/FAD synthetase [Helicobacter monodelphidis]|uniref:bifunctional riboflavin kinase/FAD synthetase n=1 Tax=Helicobacter sp. 15-1451 TaxID=2004995 RepID=UPI0015EBE420|nr:bifunctional riboflavin kinase/FAD synthetase [Helicobacter sp. 15-1451]
MKRLLSISQDSSITSIVIGKFDGLHRAHRKLFSYLDGGGAIIVIHMAQENLTPGEMKQEFTSYPIFTIEFDAIKHLSGEDFFSLLLQNFPCLQKIIVGYDFRCGKNRSFGAEDIQRVFKGEVKIVPEIHYKGRAIHATDIRQLLMEGKIYEANELLGRAYLIEGKIIRGQGLGKKKLIPTINLDIHTFLLPKDGVYCSYTQIKDTLYSSITFIGKRVTTDHHFAVETHLLAPMILEEFYHLPDNASLFFSEAQLSSYARVHFLKYLRANRKFSSLKDLRKQINVDLLEAKVFHREHRSLFYNIWFAREY